MITFNGDLVILEIKVSIELERRKEKRAWEPSKCDIRERMYGNLGRQEGPVDYLFTLQCLVFLSVKWVNSTYLIGVCI